MLHFPAGMSPRKAEKYIMSGNEQAIGSKGWISYRPEIKVLDVTIRDGGLMNDHKFDIPLVNAVYQAVCDAGIDYMELGYKGSKRIFSASHIQPRVSEKGGLDVTSRGP